MREIPIDRIIVNLGEARGIAQGELAEVMGVSKASVSKWEIGSSYPDILLLPRLASYFQVSIDGLMGYSPQMTGEEIRETFAKLADEFSEGNVVPVLEECRGLVRDYMACFPVLLWLVLFYVNCLRGVGEEYQEETLKEVLELCLCIREQCDEVTVRKQAVGLEGACPLLLGRPGETLKLLGRDVAILPRDGCIISLAYRSMGGKKKAGTVFQVSIYQHMMAVVDDLISYLYLNGDDGAVFEETWRRLQEMFETFHMRKLKPAVVLQAYMVAAGIFSKNREEERATELLEDYLELYHSCDDMSELHGNTFFDEVEGWLGETVMSSGLMGSQRAVQKNAVNGMLEEPEFDSLRELPEFQEIPRQLKS